MLLLYILLAVAALVLLKYLYLIVKRLRLISRLRRQVGKRGGSMRYCRNPLASVFRHDGKTDLSLRLPDKTVGVCVLTTPLRRVRYHFDVNDGLLELIVERKGVYMVNPRVPRPSAVMDRAYTILKYKMGFEAPEPGAHSYVILHPAPRSISKAEGAALTPLYNNDTLTPGVRVCGLKWFIENVFGEKQ